MKKYLLAAILSITGFIGIHAQQKAPAKPARVVVIHKADGATDTLMMSEVEKITFGLSDQTVESPAEAEAIDLLQNSQNKNVLRSFPEDENVKVMNGRYGAYITNGTDNFKISKGVVAENLTYEDCMQIIQNTAPTAKRRTTRKKA